MRSPARWTWEFASRFCKVLPKSVLHEALEGTVGKGAAAEFLAFQKIQNDLPDLTPILNGDKSFKPTKVDIRYALVSALAQRAESGKHFDNLIQYSEVLPAEFSVLLVQMLGSKDKARLLAQPSIEVWAREDNDLVITRGAK